MNRASTETCLRDWRYGQTQAERLAAAILHLEGYSGVDPQCPLGGPDGKKDVLFQKDGSIWVAAAYFPPTQPTFGEIKTKFSDDFLGVAQNSAAGLAFFVNQKITPSERQELKKVSGAYETEIYHIERMLSLLDAPKGYGVRLQFLRIAMSEEEQLAFSSITHEELVKQIASLHAKFDSWSAELARTQNRVADVIQGSSSLSTPNPEIPEIDAPTAMLSLESICWVHRLITTESRMPESMRGRFRNTQVWIGAPGSTPDNAAFVPPPPEEVIQLTAEFVAWWRGQHVSLRDQAKEAIAVGLAQFHHRFLRVHPFLDGNGQVARALLDQASRELLNLRISSDFISNVPHYFECLDGANKGDLKPLTRLVLSSLR